MPVPFGLRSCSQPPARYLASPDLTTKYPSSSCLSYITTCRRTCPRLLRRFPAPLDSDLPTPRPPPAAHLDSLLHRRGPSQNPNTRYSGHIPYNWCHVIVVCNIAEILGCRRQYTTRSIPSCLYTEVKNLVPRWLLQGPHRGSALSPTRARE